MYDVVPVLYRSSNRDIPAMGHGSWVCVLCHRCVHEQGLREANLELCGLNYRTAFCHVQWEMLISLITLVAPLVDGSHDGSS